jgi:hypothetical protein
MLLILGEQVADGVFLPARFAAQHIVQMDARRRYN